MKRFLGLAVALAATGVASAAVSILPTNTPFTNISVSGTSLGAPGDDPEYTLTAASLTGAGFTGNSLLAGGVDVCVGNNGAVVWNATLGTHQVGYTNVNLLTMAAANLGNTGNGNGTRQFIAPHWDDLLGTTTAPASSVTWQVTGGNLTIQWSEEDHFAASGTGRITFQMIVYSGLGPNNQFADFVYNDTLYTAGQIQSDGGSASIGYKDWGVTGQGDAQWSFNPRDGGIAGAGVAGYVSNDGTVGSPNALMLVPEPASFGLLALGALALIRRR